MIKVKHFLDSPEPDDGRRLWVEPWGLTRDLADWCAVDCSLTTVAPPRALRNWLEKHPDGYDHFRERYHEYLAEGPHVESLTALACQAMRENLTLLHESDVADRNVATALHEFLSELEAYCPREE